VYKWWCLLFAVVNLACLGLFIVAPFVGWWLPEGVSSHADEVDWLFYLILWITGFFFVLTEVLLVYFMWEYAAKPGSKEHVFGHGADEQRVYWTSYFKHLFRPVSALLHDQHRVEMAWTFVPAVILLLIAFVQVKAWADIKYQSRYHARFDGNENVVQLEISARQFEWRMRYPSPERMAEWKKDPKLAHDFGRSQHIDDIHVTNELHCWTDEKNVKRWVAEEDRRKVPYVLIHLKTIDVIHSLNLPHFRVKQDALPGKTIPVWFVPLKTNTKFNKKTGHWDDGGGRHPRTGEPRDADLVWEIPCAELCGWGHYRMIGRVYVHPSEQDFMDWLRDAQKRQGATN
jgi:cytochrome c oxidase subunit 2